MTILLKKGDIVIVKCLKIAHFQMKSSTMRELRVVSLWLMNFEASEPKFHAICF